MGFNELDDSASRELVRRVEEEGIDVVGWLKREMELMVAEEIERSKQDSGK